VANILSIDVVRADLGDEKHAEAVLALLSHYALDEMAGARPLPDAVRESVIAGLRAHPTTDIQLAFDGERAVGVAICFIAFSTFRAQRILNIHDLAVLDTERGKGIGRKLLGAVEVRARELGCCKLTLEVLEHNRRARGLYGSYGFGHFAPGEAQHTTFFLEKPISP